MIPRVLVWVISGALFSGEPPTAPVTLPDASLRIEQMIVVGPGVPGLKSSTLPNCVETIPAARVFPVAVLSPPSTEAVRFMGRAIGHWVSQTELMREIVTRFPDLAPRALLVQSAFMQAFGPAISQIAVYLPEMEGGALSVATIRDQALAAADQSLASGNPRAQRAVAWRHPEWLTAPAAISFLDLVERRALGEWDDVTAAAFTLFHPQVIADPEVALASPFVRRWRSGGVPSALGLDVEMAYPGGWSATASDEPGVTQSFQPFTPLAEASPRMTLCLRNAGPLASLTPEQVAALMGDQQMALSAIPQGSTVITHAAVSFASTTAMEVTFRHSDSSASRPNGAGICWMLIHEDHLIVITGLVRVPDHVDPLPAYARFGSIFQKMAHSLAFSNSSIWTLDSAERSVPAGASRETD